MPSSRGIFPTQGSNPSLLHYRQILYHLSHQGSPRILERVAYPLLQGIFPIQELNWDLLHCTCILYQLNHQGSPNVCILPYAAAAKSLQSWPTLYDPIDGIPPGYPVPGILLARTLEWVAIAFSSAWKWKVKVKSLSCVRLLATPWSAAYQAPPSMGFARQEYWSGLPLPSPIRPSNQLQLASGQNHIFHYHTCVYRSHD